MLPEIFDDPDIFLPGHPLLNTGGSLGGFCSLDGRFRYLHIFPDDDFRYNPI